MNNEAERKLAVEIMTWLDTPLQHLGNESRRHAIEGLLIVHANRIRRAASRKSAVQAVAMWGGLVGLVLTLALNLGKVIEVIGP